ncbi:MAG: GNAT family N-acetyltransferase [Pseudomonadota bacterium]
MTAQALAALHRAAVGPTQGWSDDSFGIFLDDPTCSAIVEDEGFILGRVVAGEAEVLMLAVVPEARRQGLGRRLLARFEDEARARGAASVFLEVAEDNAPARAVYAAGGYDAVGQRRAYYARASGVNVDALILRKSLTPNRR